MFRTKTSAHCREKPNLQRAPPSWPEAAVLGRASILIGTDVGDMLLEEAILQNLEEDKAHIF